MAGRYAPVFAVFSLQNIANIAGHIQSNALKLTGAQVEFRIEVSSVGRFRMQKDGHLIVLVRVDKKQVS